MDEYVLSYQYRLCADLCTINSHPGSHRCWKCPPTSGRVVRVFYQEVLPRSDTSTGVQCYVPHAEGELRSYINPIVILTTVVRPTLVLSFHGYPCSPPLLWLIASCRQLSTDLQWSLSCFSSSPGSSVSRTSRFQPLPSSDRYIVLTWVFDQPEEAETGGQYVSSTSAFAVFRRFQVVFVVPVGDKLPLHRSVY